MSPIQTSYNERHRVALPGMVGGSDYGSKTGIVETAAGIGFGLAVSQGTNDKGVILGGSLAAFVGASIRDVASRNLMTDTVDKYANTKNMGYLNRGQIWVVPTTPVTPTSEVHFSATTGEFAASGGLGPVPGAKWVTSSAAGEPALLELMARGA